MERLSWQCGPTDAAELEEARRLCFFVGDYLGGGFKYFLFSPLPGEMIQFD